MSGPVVSVIVPAYFSQETVASCLRSVRRQTYRRFEVILVDSSPGGESAGIVRREFPEVTVRAHSSRLLPHQARNLGAELAKGRILTFSDPDCVACPRWLELIVAAHENGHDAVGGAVDCPPGWWNRSVHMVKYSWWLPGGRPGVRPEIPSANSSFSREMWERAGPYRGEWFAGDSELSWRIRASGAGIWFVPDAVVTHHHPQSPGELIRDRFSRGKDYGELRPRARGWSRLRCALQLLLLPVLPLLMTMRAASYALRSGYGGVWLLSLPVQVGANSAWCCGEAVSHWSRLWKALPGRSSPH